MKRLPRKRRTREHIIADLSVNHVERHALLCGYTLQRMTHDYGIDLELVTFDKKGNAQEGAILIQVKASGRISIRGDEVAFPFRIERRDLVRWLAEPMPVILIVYDAKQEVAYWLYVQSHFRKREGFNLFIAGKTIAVSIPTANVMEPAAVRKFARFRDRVVEQMIKVIHDEDEANPIR